MGSDSSTLNVLSVTPSAIQVELLPPVVYLLGHRIDRRPVIFIAQRGIGLSRRCRWRGSLRRRRGSGVPNRRSSGSACRWSVTLCCRRRCRCRWPQDRLSSSDSPGSGGAIPSGSRRKGGIGAGRRCGCASCRPYTVRNASAGGIRQCRRGVSGSRRRARARHCVCCGRVPGAPVTAGQEHRDANDV